MPPWYTKTLPLIDTGLAFSPVSFALLFRAEIRSLQFPRVLIPYHSRSAGMAEMENHLQKIEGNRKKGASGKYSRRDKENLQIAEKVEQLPMQHPDKGYRRIRDDIVGILLSEPAPDGKASALSTEAFRWDRFG